MERFRTTYYLQLVKSKIHLLLHRLQLGLDLLQLILYIEYGHVWNKSDFICCIGEDLNENGCA